MSVLRFSAVHDRLYAVSSVGEDAGRILNPSYDFDRKAGSLGSFPHPAGSVDEAPPYDFPHVDQAMVDMTKTALGKITSGAPVTVLVHGFLFKPREVLEGPYFSSDNPHYRIYHFTDGDIATETRHHSTGWPLHLGFKADDAGENGLVVPFGWESSPGFVATLFTKGTDHYKEAYKNAGETSWPLVVTLHALAKVMAGTKGCKSTPIDIVCHSLGSALVMRALSRMAKYGLPVLSRIGRVIVMGGSELRAEANFTYGRIVAAAKREGWKADTGPVIYNLGSRENSVLDIMAENFTPTNFGQSSQVIGHNGLGGNPGQERWIDLQIDSEALKVWLGKNRGVDILGDDPGSILDHWIYYTHRGNLRAMASILRNRVDWSLAALRSTGGKKKPVPEGIRVSPWGD